MPHSRIMLTMSLPTTLLLVGALQGRLMAASFRAGLCKPKFCGKRTQQPTCSLAEADLDVVQVAGGSRHTLKRCLCCCSVVADRGQRNESRLTRQEQSGMSLRVQRTRKQAVMLSCRRRAVENATRASGIVVSTQVAGGGWERRAGVGDVITRAADNATRAGGDNVIAWAADKATREGSG